MAPLKVGILTNEVADARVGRIGGFGWAARETTRLFLARPALGVEPVLLTGEIPDDGTRVVTVDGARLLLKPRSPLAHARRLWSERIDLLLTIDWRPGYRLHAAALPRTPIAVWVRDPRTPEDARRIAAIRDPGAPGTTPGGVHSVDTRSLRQVSRWSRLARRRLALVTTERALAAKVTGAYGVAAAEVTLLPNPITLTSGTVAKAVRPTVAFLGRLDACKRPWLLFDLAARLPDVTFLVVGSPHLDWKPPEPPPNLQLLGHVDGAAKAALLAGAWALVNTSTHEGLPVSFLEALAVETPLAAFVDTGGVVSRFGISAGPSGGDGRAELPTLAAALRRLIDDEALRTRLGAAGRAWVEVAHGPDAFVAGFIALRQRLGL